LLLTIGESNFGTNIISTSIPTVVSNWAFVVRIATFIRCSQLEAKVLEGPKLIFCTILFSIAVFVSVTSVCLLVSYFE
jgi:hypothetical protein